VYKRRTFQINFQIQENESYVGTNQINILKILTIFDESPKKILWTNAGGYQGRGRPKSRWIDRVEEDTRKLGCRKWRADAQDRGHWRHLFEEVKAHPGLYSQ
jgi:hypothetical protein